MRLRIIIASSVVLLCGAADQHGVVQQKNEYAEQKLAELGGITKGYTSQLAAFAGLDSSKLSGIDENEFFKQVQFPLMKALPKALKPFGHPGLYPGTGPYTAVDMLTFKVNKATRQVEGLIIIVRGGPENPLSAHSGIGKIAPIGGFSQYGQTFAETGIREAEEEVGIHVPPATVQFVGVYDDPKRDPRGHTVSIAYTGATYDTPQETMEARGVKIMTLAELEATTPDQWFVADHRTMAIEAYRILNAGSSRILGGLVSKRK